MNETTDKPWAMCLRSLKGKLSAQSYDTWLKPLKCQRFDAKTVVLEAPHSFTVSWIGEHYLRDIKSAIRHHFDITPQIEFTVRPATQNEQPNGWTPPLEPGNGNGEHIEISIAPDDSAVAVHSADESDTTLTFNQNYTFSSLVVGSCNEVAFSAAKTVAETPGRTPFNPLVIYGGVGLGKTHMLQAIANQCLKNGTARRPMYVTSEQFTQDFVTSLKEHNTLQFAKRYRTADVLMIDDIQFFQNKERMQEEFFHTFNTLHDQGKQIILSSDRPPESLGGLQDRLLSRIQWGLVADIQPPDLETRIAITQSKAESEGLHLTDGIAEYIANQVRHNIRELEGIVKRILFLVENLHTKLSLEVAERAVRTMRTAAPTEQVDIARIQEAIAAHYHVPMASLVGKTRRSDIVSKRQMAMYLCKQLTGDSLRAIGSAFGGRDHSTVLYACRKIRKAIAEDAELLAELTAIATSLGCEHTLSNTA